MTEASERPLRLFVAIELPDAWHRALADAQEVLRAALAQDDGLSGARLRWMRPEGIHLTLKFIGEVAPTRVAVLRDQLALAVPARPDIEISLTRIGSFSDRRAPRVVWAGIDTRPARALQPLFESIETWLAAAGVARERRSFRPHLTLARLPDGLTDAQRLRIAEITSAAALPHLPPFTVEGVSLMQSFLGPGGARYERLGRWPDDFTGRDSEG
jgi:RNA 2',3'-cyclic 3'-phosphodiesterase